MSSPSSLFTQVVVVLFEAPPGLDTLESTLGGYAPRRRVGLDATNPWVTEGAELLIAMRPEANGCVVVDVSSRPWPDRLVSPDEDTALSEAAAAGFLGPHVYPGALRRAVEQRWGWPEAPEFVQRHHAVVRIRITYALGTGGPTEGDHAPADRDPLSELHFITGVAAKIAALSGAVGVFFPSAESVRSPEQVSESLELLNRDRYLPLDLWTNTRLFQLEDLPEHVMMDCVGLVQLGLPDVELVFGQEAFELDEIDQFVRELAALMIIEGRPLAVGTALRGPSDSRWSVLGGESPLAEPPRAFLRLVPEADADLVSRTAFFAI